MIMVAAEFFDIGKSPKSCFVLVTHLALRRVFDAKGICTVTKNLQFAVRRPADVFRFGGSSDDINLAVDIVPVKRID